MLVDRAGADPLLIAAELDKGIGAAWPGGTGRGADRAMVALVDNRSLACPSPGRRHDLFAAMRLVPSGTVARGVIDSGGASDHDAVHASFALQGGADDPILCLPAGRVR